MILRLVVLQFRNGWRSTVSTAATLALTVAFATFAMVLAATQVAHAAPATAFTPTGYQHLAEIDSVFGDPAPKVEHPDFQNVMSLADVEALAVDPDLTAEINAFVEQVNSKRSRVEHVRKYRILPHDFTVAAGEMTPTLKVKRNVVNSTYADLIDAMYAEG